MLWQIHPIDFEIFHWIREIFDFLVALDEKSVRRSTKINSLGIFGIAVEIFQSGPKRWTNRLTDAIPRATALVTQNWISILPKLPWIKSVTSLVTILKSSIKGPLLESGNDLWDFSVMYRLITQHPAQWQFTAINMGAVRWTALFITWSQNSDHHPKKQWVCPIIKHKCLLCYWV